MNLIPAKITHIHAVEHLSQVDFTTFKEPMSMVSLSLDKSMTVGSDVTLGVKATSISLAKASCQELTLSNQLPVEIVQITRGDILSSIKLSFNALTLESIITTRSLERLGFKEGEAVTALVKASELSIMELNH